MGGNRMHNITAVIFDLDGTLLNTLEDLKNSVNATLRAYGYPERSLEEVRQFVGNGVARLMELAVPNPVDSKKAEEILAYFKKDYAKNCNIHTAPYEGIASLLQQLKAKGYALGIVSNKFDAAVKDLNHLYFSNYIDVAIGQQEGVRKKPYPDTVNLALNKLGCKAEATLYIGDSEVDIETARNAGLQMISVDWGFRKRDELLQHGATTIVSHPKEVLLYL